MNRKFAYSFIHYMFIKSVAHLNCINNNNSIHKFLALNRVPRWTQTPQKLQLSSNGFHIG